MRLSPTQLKVLAAIRFGRLRYYRDLTAHIDSDHTVVSVATTRALIRKHLIAPDRDDDTLWSVTPTGEAMLRLEPGVMERAGREHARAEGQTIVSAVVSRTRIESRTPAMEAAVEAGICVQLQERGSATADIGELVVQVPLWRSLARAAARKLGRPVQTIVAGDHVHAVLRDWSADERERRIHDAQKRVIGNAVTLPPLDL